MEPTIGSFTILNVSAILDLSEASLNRYISDISGVISRAKATPGYIFSTLSEDDLDQLTDSQLYTYTVNLSTLMQKEAQNTSYLDSYTYAFGRKAQIAESTLAGLSTIQYNDSLLFANYSTTVMANEALYASTISTATGLQIKIDASAQNLIALSTTLGQANSTLAGEILVSTQAAAYSVSPEYLAKVAALAAAELAISKAEELANHTSTMLATSQLESTTTALQYQQISTAAVQTNIDIEVSDKKILEYSKQLADLSSSILSTIAAETTLDLASKVAMADLNNAVAISTFTSLNSQLLTAQGVSGPQTGGSIDSLKAQIAAINIDGTEAAAIAQANTAMETYNRAFTEYLSEKASTISTNVGYAAEAAAYTSTANSLSTQSAEYTAQSRPYDISAQIIMLDLQKLSVASALADSAFVNSSSTLAGINQAITSALAQSNALMGRSKLFESYAAAATTDLASAEEALKASIAASAQAIKDDAATSMIISKEQANLETAYYTLANTSVNMARAAIDLSIGVQTRLQGEYAYKEYLLRQTRAALNSSNSVTVAIDPYITACENLAGIESSIISSYQLTSTTLTSREPISISGDIIKGKINTISTASGLQQGLINTYSVSNTGLGPIIAASSGEMNRASTIFGTKMEDLSASDTDLAPLAAAYKAARLIHMSNTGAALNNTAQLNVLNNKVQESQATISDLQNQYSIIAADLIPIDGSLSTISSAIMVNQKAASTLMSTIDVGVSTQLSYMDMQELLSTFGYAVSSVVTVKKSDAAVASDVAVKRSDAAVASGATVTGASGPITYLAASGPPAPVVTSGPTAPIVQIIASGPITQTKVIPSGPTTPIVIPSGPTAPIVQIIASGPIAQTKVIPSGPTTPIVIPSGPTAPTKGIPSGPTTPIVIPSGPTAPPTTSTPPAPTPPAPTPPAPTPPTTTPPAPTPPAPTPPTTTPPVTIPPAPTPPTTTPPVTTITPVTTPPAAPVSTKMPTVAISTPIQFIPSFTTPNYVPFIPI